MSKIFFFLIIGSFIVIVDASVHINEIMYKTSKISNQEVYEFVEIYNASDQAIDLAGWQFTAGILYVFPSVILSAGDYLVVGKDTAALHSRYPFLTAWQWQGGQGLNNSGETLVLQNSVGITIDSVKYKTTGDWPKNFDADYSIELNDSLADRNMGTSWSVSKDWGGSPGAINSPLIPQPNPQFSPLPPNFGRVLINSTRALELTITNIGSGDYSINSITQSQPGIYSVSAVLPQNLVSGEAVSFVINFTPLFEQYYPDTLIFHDNDGDHRIPLWGRGISAFAPPSVAINEIMYNPLESGTDTTEFIELTNYGAESIDLSGWGFSQGVVFTFPPGTALAAGTYLVIAGDASAFTGYYGQAPDFEWNSGTLSNSGEMIELINADSNQVDSVAYKTGTTWPSTANGQGYSLELNRPMYDNSQGENWSASLAPGGTPRAINSVAIPRPQPVWSPTIFDFQTVYTDETITLTGVLTNEGSTDYIISGSQWRHGFYFQCDLPSSLTLSGGATLNFNITFSPTVSGDWSDTLDIADNISGAKLIVRGTARDRQPFYQLVINEIMYDNPGSDTLEYIELYNRENQNIDLDGYQVSGGVDYTFPPGSRIEANSYIVIAGDAAAFQNFYRQSAEHEFGGTLLNNGESVVLVNSDGLRLDSVYYLVDDTWPRAGGTAYSLELRSPELDNLQGSNWMNSIDEYGTPGALNSNLAPRPRPEYFLESINLNRIVVNCTTACVFTIGNRGDAVYQLYSLSLKYNVDLKLVPSRGISIEPGRTSNIILYFAATSVGAIFDTLVINDNADGARLQVQAVVYIPQPLCSLAINEIMYNNPGSDTLEFIEIVNTGQSPALLGDHWFENGVVYRFPANAVLAPDSFWVIAGDSSAFQQYYGYSASDEWSSGSLLNTGESLVIINRDSALIDSLTYGIRDPWPDEANGGGPSLELYSPDALNHVGGNWRASALFGGTPGKANTTTISPPPAPGLMAPLDHSIDMVPEVIFSWHSLENGISWQWQLAMDSIFSSSIRDSVLTDTAFVFSNLSWGTRYYWRVRAWNLGGWGDFSAGYTFTTLPRDTVPPYIASIDPVSFSKSIDPKPLIAIVFGDDRYFPDSNTLDYFVNQQKVEPNWRLTEHFLHTWYRPASPWPYGDTVNFSLTIADTSGNQMSSYEFYYIVRPDTNCPVFTLSPRISLVNFDSLMLSWNTDKPTRYLCHWQGVTYNGNSLATEWQVPVPVLRWGGQDSLQLLCWDIFDNQCRWDTLLEIPIPDTVAPRIIDGPLIHFHSDWAELAWRASEPCRAECNYGERADSLDYICRNDSLSDEHTMRICFSRPGRRVFWTLTLSDSAGNRLNTPPDSFLVPGSFTSDSLYFEVFPYIRSLLDSKIDLSCRLSMESRVRLFYGNCTGEFSDTIESSTYQKDHDFQFSCIQNDTLYYCLETIDPPGLQSPIGVFELPDRIAGDSAIRLVAGPWVEKNDQNLLLYFLTNRSVKTRVYCKSEIGTILERSDLNATTRHVFNFYPLTPYTNYCLEMVTESPYQSRLENQYPTLKRSSVGGSLLTINTRTTSEPNLQPLFPIKYPCLERMPNGTDIIICRTQLLSRLEVELFDESGQLIWVDAGKEWRFDHFIELGNLAESKKWHVDWRIYAISGDLCLTDSIVWSSPPPALPREAVCCSLWNYPGFAFLRVAPPMVSALLELETKYGNRLLSLQVIPTIQSPGFVFGLEPGNFYNLNARLIDPKTTLTWWEGAWEVEGLDEFNSESLIPNSPLRLEWFPDSSLSLSFTTQLPCYSRIHCRCENSSDTLEYYEHIITRFHRYYLSSFSGNSVYNFQLTLSLPGEARISYDTTFSIQPVLIPPAIEAPFFNEEERTDSSIRLHWRGNPAGQFKLLYRLERDTGSGFELLHWPWMDTSYIERFISRDSCRYRVQAVWKGFHSQESEFSDILTVFPTVSYGEPYNRCTPAKPRVYPNPCSDYLIVEFPSEALFRSCKLTFYNILGEKVLRKEFDFVMERRVFVGLCEGGGQSLPQGVYILELICGTGRYHYKVLMLR